MDATILLQHNHTNNNSEIWQFSKNIRIDIKKKLDFCLVKLEFCYQYESAVNWLLMSFCYCTGLAYISIFTNYLPRVELLAYT